MRHLKTFMEIFIYQIKYKYPVAKITKNLTKLIKYNVRSTINIYNTCVSLTSAKVTISLMLSDMLT